MTKADIEQIKRLLETMDEVEKREILSHIRASVPLHPMEQKLNASAETILGAIGRSSDLTIRGIEGLIAEAAFETEILPKLVGWEAKRIVGDQPFDFLLADSTGEIKLQVKMQRRIARRPLMANEVRKRLKWPADYFIVETQRTRTGESKKAGKTRPYRFGSFDILAVSMGASKGRWSAFLYTVERWLLPSDKDTNCLLTYQPVAPAPTECWTDDFCVAVRWFRSGVQKIWG